MKYTAYLVTGGTVTLEHDHIEQAIVSSLDDNRGAPGWLVDNAGVMVNLVHVCALVPGKVQPAPEHITDGQGDVWTRNTKGMYNLTLAGKESAGYRDWPRERIVQRYGIRE